MSTGSIPESKPGGNEVCSMTGSSKIDKWAIVKDDESKGIELKVCWGSHEQ